MSTPVKTDNTVPATATATAKPKREEIPFYRVRLTHPMHLRRTVFRSVSENRARAFVETRYPRGSEAYLEHPDGTTESHEAERTGERGADAERWALFNPDDYVPVEYGAPPGQDEWSDREG